tara:strand:+ start:2299 stop:2547 length:249 start_codon:yes stop_codon:yes gene_type:complete
MPNKKMSPGEMKAMTGKTTKRKGVIQLVGGVAGLTAGSLVKAFKKAKENKPTGRLNLDDISRAMKPMKPSKPSKPLKPMKKD